MLEHGDVLLTWQLLHEPRGPGSLPILARRIGDHRKAYLDYEGPLNAGRGHVTRVARGGLSIYKLTEKEVTFDLDDPTWSGRFLLRKLIDRWVFDWAYAMG